MLITIDDDQQSDSKLPEDKKSSSARKQRAWRFPRGQTSCCSHIVMPDWRLWVSHLYHLQSNTLSNQAILHHLMVMISGTYRQHPLSSFSPAESYGPASTALRCQGTQPQYCYLAARSADLQIVINTLSSFTTRVAKCHVSGETHNSSLNFLARSLMPNLYYSILR